MATKDEITLCDETGEPVVVCWTDIEPDGSESQRTGSLWSVAPPIGGMRSWWVLPHRWRAKPVRVALASGRRRCGRQDANGRYYEKTGRYVDKGEWFRETDPRSRFASAEPPGRASISGRPRTTAAQTNLALFEAIIATHESERAQ